MRNAAFVIARHRQGFTLIEMIIAIVLTGIVVAMVGLFIRQPIQAYFDVAPGRDHGYGGHCHPADRARCA
jgi:prepilin-type N-terminal cleavage/methylation domain-containing protein